MKYLALPHRAVAAIAMLTFFGLTSLATFATEATPTQAGKTAVAAENTSTGSVARAIFTTAVEDGEPTDFLSEIPNSVPEVFFFTELEGVMGQTVIHRWTYRSKVMATAEFDVDRDPDKVWSSLKMKPEWAGAWVVEVVDGDDNIIGRGTLAFEEPL